MPRPTALRLLPVAAILASGTSQAAAQDFGALVPDTVAVTPGVPTVALLGGSTSGVASLTLFAPLVELPGEAGAGELLAELARERLSGPARQAAARVAVTRSPRGLLYRVEGAEADMEYLTYLVRVAAQEPDPEPHDLARIRDGIIAGREGLLESPFGRIMDELVAVAAPDEPPSGHRGTLETMGIARLREIWRRSHFTDAMTVVAVTRFDPEVLFASLHGIGAGEPAPPAVDVPAPPEPRHESPPALRRWYGLAWTDGGPSDPHAAVLARLLAAQTRSGPSEMEMVARVRPLANRSLVVVAGAALPRRSADMRAAVDALMTDLRNGLTDEAVVVARNEVLLDLLGLLATPGGRTDFVAEFGHQVATAYVQALGSVSAGSLATYIDRLTGPVSAEVNR